MFSALFWGRLSLYKMQPNLWAQLPTGVLPWYMGPTLQCTYILCLYLGPTMRYLYPTYTLELIYSTLLSKYSTYSIPQTYSTLQYICMHFTSICSTLYLGQCMGHTMNCIYFTYYCALYVCTLPLPMGLLCSMQYEYITYSTYTLGIQYFALENNSYASTM